LAQLGEIIDELAFKVRFFSLSLSRPAFSWFVSLPHNSIEGWEDIETKFHHYFNSRVMEKGITNLVDVRQRNNEPVLHYLQRFKEVRNQCYTLTLSEAELVSIVLTPFLDTYLELMRCRSAGRDVVTSPQKSC
jgi:hypothetical protein